MSTVTMVKVNLREKMTALKAKAAAGSQAPPVDIETQAPPPREATPVDATAELRKRMAEKTKASAGKTVKPRVATDNAMTQMLDKYFHHAEEAKSHKAMADTCRDQIVAAAKPLFYEECTKKGESLSSITIGKGKMTVVNNYSIIELTEAQNLADCFGSEYATYFKPYTELSVNKESANDPVVFNTLIEKLGAEFFEAHFKLKEGLKVTEALHVAINTNALVRDAAQSFIDQQVIKPYSPSIKLA